MAAEVICDACGKRERLIQLAIHPPTWWGWVAPMEWLWVGTGPPERPIACSEACADKLARAEAEIKKLRAAGEREAE